MKNALLLFINLLWTSWILAQPGNGFTCLEAVCLSDNLGVTISNAASPPTPPLSFTCGVTHNNIFYAFCPKREQVVLSVNPSNCTTGLGVQAIIYQTNDCTNFEELVCVSNGTTGSFNINFSGTPGETYILMIDGFSGDVCDFTITGTGITDFAAPPEKPELSIISDTLELCAGDSFPLEVINDDGQCKAYFWEVQVGLGIITLDENGSKATINGISSGEAVLCVKADNFCYESEVCLVVKVDSSPQIDPIDKVVVCESLVNFCDYSSFFDPPLNPDPLMQGWDISFYESFAEAEADLNAIQCPYTILPGNTDTIYIRYGNEGFCNYSISSFELEYQEPEPILLAPEQFCLLKGSVLTAIDLIVEDINGLDYEILSFHLTKEQAEQNEFEILAVQLDTVGIYTLWVRATTDEGCFSIRQIQFEITDEAKVSLAQVEWRPFGSFFSVTINTSGPSGPYTVEWEDGVQANERIKLEQGIHHIDVYDQFGCAKEFRISTPGITYMPDFNVPPQLIPNPASPGGVVYISRETRWQEAELYNSEGNLVRSYILSQDQLFNLDHDLPRGVYYVQLKSFMLAETLTLMVW